MVCLRKLDTVISDYEDSMVTYTAVSSPFGGLSDIGSSGVDGHRGLQGSISIMWSAFQAPPSPDYVSGLEYLPSPNFVPELVYPEFMPPEDEVIPAEEQSLPAVVSPTADSPGYVPESDPEEDLEEDDDEDPKEDHTDYPTDGGDDGDDEDKSSNDDEDDDVDIEGDEEEHPAHVDSTDVSRLLAIPTLPPSPLSPWSSPLPQIPSPLLPPILSPLPVSPPLPISSPPPANPICPLGYQDAMIRLRVEAPSTSHSLPLPLPIILSHTRSDAPSSRTPPLLPIPLPTSSPPLHLLFTDRRADKPEVTLPPRKRLGIALGLRYEVGESSPAPTARPPGVFRADYGFVATMDREIMRDLERYFGYRITDTWDEMLVDMLGAPATDDIELGRRMTEFTTRVRQDTDEIYTSSARFWRLRLGCLERLGDDPWMLVTLHDQKAAITEMLAADHRRQAQFIEVLKLLKRLQTQMPEFERQKGPYKVCTARWDRRRRWQIFDIVYGLVILYKPTKVLRVILASMALGVTVALGQHVMLTENTNGVDSIFQEQGTGEKKPYGGSKPLCSKCNYHHDGPCAPKCHKCNKVGHFARDYRSTTNANNANNQKGTGSGQKPTCYECGVQEHFKRECPKLKNNNNRSNQVGGGNASAKVYAVGHAGTNPDSNVMTGTFLLNNRYASI
ncbi:putative reverse transcriptase domain-containing protein [Tanacetum coccineum]